MNHLRASWRERRSPDATAFVSIRYETLATLGAGGMGSVHLARPRSGPRAGQLVALKRIVESVQHRPEALEAFLDEVWLVSALHHPHVIEALDWGHDAHGSFLALQYVRGGSLRMLLDAREAQGEPLPVALAVELVARVAEGLHAAHELRDERGAPLELVHRDVSPANVLLGFDGAVKLIDFGVARAVGRRSDTRTGMIKGKYGYMSPEQVRGEPLDRRSDVFALGVVLWEALTLCRLYQGATEFDVMGLICTEMAPAPSDLRAEVPEALDRAVLRCLAKQPHERFASCAALLAALEPYRARGDAGTAALASLLRASLAAHERWLDEAERGDHRDEPEDRPVAAGATGTADALGDDPRAARRTETGATAPQGAARVRVRKQEIAFGAGASTEAPPAAPRAPPRSTARVVPDDELTDEVDPASLAAAHARVASLRANTHTAEPRARSASGRAPRASTPPPVPLAARAPSRPPALVPTASLPRPAPAPRTSLPAPALEAPRSPSPAAPPPLLAADRGAAHGALSGPHAASLLSLAPPPPREPAPSYAPLRPAQLALIAVAAVLVAAGTATAVLQLAAR